jgi:hypothetical protein
MRSCPKIFISSAIQQMPLESSIVVQKLFNFDWMLNSCFIGLCSDSGFHSRVCWWFPWFRQSFHANDEIVFQNRPRQLSSHPSQIVVRSYPLIRWLIISVTEKETTWAAQKDGWAFRVMGTVRVHAPSEHSNLVAEFLESRYVSDSHRDTINHSLQRLKYYDRELKYNKRVHEKLNIIITRAIKNFA